jgi:hypothetical protein
MRAERTILAIENILNRKDVALRDRLADANVVINLYESKEQASIETDALLYERYGVDLEDRRI